MIEHFGFQSTFLITACIKTASFVPLVVLLFVLNEPEAASCLPLWFRREPALALPCAPEEGSDGTLEAPLLAPANGQIGAEGREE